MPTYTVTARYSWNGAARQATPRVTQPAGDSPARPVVVLLHGLQGDVFHMANPQASPGFTHDRTATLPAVREHGWRSFPGIGLWSHAFDPDVKFEGWETALNAAGFSTVNYGQAKPNGALSGEPLTQLSAVMQELMAEPRLAGRTFALVAHSRGGILARALLVGARRGTLPTFPNRAFDLARVRRLVTLHSPHLGSSLANAGVAVIDALVNLLTTVAPLPMLLGLRDLLRDEAGALAMQDIAFNSPFLDGLKSHEPVPGVQYATWGGTSTVITRHRAWTFTADSARPRWHAPPFYWRTQRTELGPLLRFLAPPPNLPGLPPELTHGSGDLLVADAAARLPHIPGTPHRTNALNHAEALWDATLKRQVIDHLKAA